MGTYRVTNTPNPSHSGCSRALLVSPESCGDAACQGGSSSRGTAFPFLAPPLDLKSHPLLKALLIRDRAQTKHRKCFPATVPSSARFPHVEGRQLSVALMFVPMDPLRETSCLPWQVSLQIFGSGVFLANERRL